MKPGWKTSEFWITLVTKLLAFMAVIGAIKTADEQNLAQTATSAIMGVFAILAAAKVIAEYIKGRSSVKSAAPLFLFALLLLPAQAFAQCQCGPTCPAGCQCGCQVVRKQPTNLFGNPAWQSQINQRLNQHDSQLQAHQTQINTILQTHAQILAQQAQLMTLLQQQHAQPATPPQIIVLGSPQQQQPQQQPQHIVLGGPQQQIPLGGPPLQNIPLGGPPAQNIPLGGPPAQQIPLGGPPAQQIPLGGPPLQQIPLGNPQQPGQQIPLGPAPQPQQAPHPQLGTPPAQQIPIGPPPKTGTLQPQRYTQIYYWQPASR